MKLSISYNGDLDLIENLGDYKNVFCFYGGSSKEGIGSGRSAFAIPANTPEDIELAVNKAHSFGKEFNFLMNSSCMGNREFEPETYQQIVAQLDWAVEIGVDWVTIANPFVLEVCRKRHPDLKVSLSSFAMVESVERAKYFDDMGIKEITVRENISRDFALLERIQNSVQCDIQVIVNQTCLYECPMQFYHDNVMSHSSHSKDGSSKGFLDYCSIKCTYEKFSNAGNIMKARWIRPEDLSLYENIGIHHYKVTDRSKSTNWLIQAAKAYHDRQYRGNLADILNIVHIMNRRSVGPTAPKLEASSGQLHTMRKSIRALSLLDIHIDNSKLDGFIDFFKSADCRSLDCSVCGYCDEYAMNVISFPDEHSRSKSLNELDQIINGTVDNR